MKRMCSFILLLALILIGPVLSFADDVSTEPVETLTQKEEKRLIFCRRIRV